MHILIVRIYTYVEGRQLVRSAETDIKRTIGLGVKVRLESKGRREDRTKMHGIRRFIVAQRKRHSFFLHFFHHHLIGKNPVGRSLGNGIPPDSDTAATAHAATDGIVLDVGHGVFPHIHQGPVIRANGIQALVPGGHQRLYSGLGLYR